MRVSSTEGGFGNRATATVTLIEPPRATLHYDSTLIPVGKTTAVTLTVNNPNPAATIRDVATTSRISNHFLLQAMGIITSSCPGRVSWTPSTVTVNAPTLAPGSSCKVTFSVTGLSAGLIVNTVDPPTSSDGGTGFAAQESVTVVTGPSLGVAYAAPTVPQNQAVRTTYTITNNNPTEGFAGVAFTNAFPSGLAASNPVGLTNTCGGTVTAVANSSSVGLTRGAVPAGGSCTLSFNVRATGVGVKTNTTSAITTTNLGNGGPATARITIVGALNVFSVFSPGSAPFGQTVTYYVSISNTNNPTVALSGVGFTSTGTTGGLVVPAGAVHASYGCGTPTINAPVGSKVITVSNAAIAAGGTCEFSLN